MVFFQNANVSYDSCCENFNNPFQGKCLQRVYSIKVDIQMETRKCYLFLSCMMTALICCHMSRFKAKDFFQAAGTQKYK